MAKPIVNLYTQPESGITELMAGPWRDIRVVTLTAGQVESILSREEEHAGFVIEGDCSLATPDSGEYLLERDGSFALPLTGSIDITAGKNGLTLLLITLNVGE